MWTSMIITSIHLHKQTMRQKWQRNQFRAAVLLSSFPKNEAFTLQNEIENEPWSSGFSGQNQKHHNPSTETEKHNNATHKVATILYTVRTHAYAYIRNSPEQNCIKERKELIHYREFTIFTRLFWLWDNFILLLLGGCSKYVNEKRHA